MWPALRDRPEPGIHRRRRCFATNVRTLSGCGYGLLFVAAQIWLSLAWKLAKDRLSSLFMTAEAEALTREQIDGRLRRARDLIEHPERIDAAGKDEIVDLLRILVGLADTFIGRPFTIPDWLRDPHLHDRVLVEFCRLYEDGQLDLTPQLLPMLAHRFPQLVAQIETQGQGRKSGAHRVGRTMALWVEGFGKSVDEAAKIVARATDIEPESAKVQYYSWRAQKKSDENPK